MQKNIFKKSWIKSHIPTPIDVTRSDSGCHSDTARHAIRGNECELLTWVAIGIKVIRRQHGVLLFFMAVWVIKMITVYICPFMNFDGEMVW